MSKKNQVSKSILTAEIGSKLVDINLVLRKSSLKKNEISLMGGLAGIALFQFYYAQLLDRDEFAVWGTETLENIVKLIDEANHSLSYAGGITGALWTIQHLNQKGFVDVDCDQLFEGIDDLLIPVMKSDFNKGYYDFLHGGLGYAFYFYTRAKNTKSELKRKMYFNELSEVVSQLKNKAEKDDQRKGIKWISKIGSINENMYGYNLSLSHGMSSILSFLVMLYQENEYESKEDLKDLIVQTVGFIYDSKFKKQYRNKSLYPAWVVPGRDKDLYSRLAWCYGDLGIALSFYKTALVLNNKELMEESLFIFKHSSWRKKSSDTLVKDACLCHGAFGNAQIFRFIYEETKLEEFDKARQFWIVQGLGMATFSNGICGFKKWIGPNEYNSNDSFLEGITGIALSMIDYISPIKNTWDQCLMISNK